MNRRATMMFLAGLLLIAAPAAFGQYVEVPGDITEPAGTAAIGVSIPIKLDYTDDAPVITPEMQALMDRCNPNKFAPETPVSSVPVAELDKDAVESMAPNDAALAASDFEILRNVDLGAGAPSGNTSGINEPSLGNNGGLIFYSGNWYASLSTNNGSTWTFVSPYTKFPSANGGFCCDQEVIFAPGNGGLMIWLLMYSPDGSGNNRYRIAIARGATNLRNGAWYYYDFTPQALGLPSSRWYDYPKVALTNGNLWIGTNVFSGGGSWTNTVMLRIPLAGLASGAGFSYNFYNQTSRFNFTPVDGATTTMYWASHNSTSSIRIYQWTDTGTSISIFDRSHTAYLATTRGTAICGPVGSNWCGRFDDRILAGFVANGVLGFGWNVRQGSGFTWPYVRWVRLSASTKTVLNNPIVFSNSNPWAYPSVGVNSRGHLGGTIFYGPTGAQSKPAGAAWISDDYNGNVLQPLTNRFLIASTHAPTKGTRPTEQGGDYLRTRPHSGQPNTWIGSIFSQQGGSTGAFARPRFTWFGRERDALVVNSNFETTTSPWVLTTNGTGSLARIAGGCNTTGNRARIIVTTAGTFRYFQLSGIRLIGRQSYKLSFYAYSNTGRDLRVSVVKSSSPSTNYGLAPTTVALGTTCTKYTYIFTPAVNGFVTDGMIRFDTSPFDLNGDTYYIDEVQLVPNVGITVAAGTEGAAAPEDAGVTVEETGDPESPAAAETPQDFFLSEAYPNPFNPATTIEYGLPEGATVRVTVYDMLGRSVSTLENADLPAGFYRTEWNGTNGSGSPVASGIYYYRIEAQGVSGKTFSMMKKMMLLK